MKVKLLDAFVTMLVLIAELQQDLWDVEADILQADELSSSLNEQIKQLHSTMTGNMETRDRWVLYQLTKLNLWIVWFSAASKHYFYAKCIVIFLLLCIVMFDYDNNSWYYLITLLSQLKLEQVEDDG